MLQSMKITSRPFEFFVALLVFIMGLYGFIDPNWPPVNIEPWEAMILIFEDAYLMTAGAVIMAAFAFRHKQLICSLVCEMFGWLFVGVAAIAIVLTSPWIPPAVFVHPDDPTYIPFLSLWLVIWGGLAGASLARFFDMRHWYRSGRK